MNRFIDTLAKFQEALRRKEIIFWSKDHWYIENSFVHLVKALFVKDEINFKRISEGLIEVLDKLESIPIRFSSSPGQTVDFLQIIEISDELFGLLKRGTEKRDLKRRILALKYRLEQSNGGLERVKDESLGRELLQRAQEWKNRHDLISDKNITGQELKYINIAAHYPEFVKFLLRDKSLERSFYNWILRDKIHPAAFIEFPGLHKSILNASLNGRIGRLGGELLKIKKIASGSEDSFKIATLPFEGKELNILDRNQIVTFRGNYQLSIKEVFNVFKNKYKEPGNLEFFADGITNWNAHKLGYWDANNRKYQLIDMNRDDWWKQLPVFEILNKEEAIQRYGKHINGYNWNAAATASRGSPSLDFENTHAYLELAIPIGNGNYVIFDMGKFATKFPVTVIEKMSVICRTVHGTIAYPDENVFYSHRDHEWHSFDLTPEQGIKLMASIKQDILAARNNNLIYQIESDNCARWLNEKLEEVVNTVPNMFRLPFIDCEPTNFFKFIFSVIRKFPVWMQLPIITALHVPLGAKASIVVEENGRKVHKSLANHEFWVTGEVFLPALLHKLKRSGVLESQNNDEDLSKIEFKRNIAEPMEREGLAQNPKIIPIGSYYFSKNSPPTSDLYQKTG